jgi:hypothetical protein
LKGGFLKGSIRLRRTSQPEAGKSQACAAFGSRDGGILRDGGRNGSWQADALMADEKHIEKNTL